jgi:hypothetical protein
VSIEELIAEHLTDIDSDPFAHEDFWTAMAEECR